MTDHHEIDLVNDLQAPTEVKEQPAPEPQPEPQTTVNEPQKTEQPAPEVNMPTDVQARLYIGFLEGLSTMMLPSVYRSRMLTSNDSVLLEKIDELPEGQLLDNVLAEDQMRVLKKRDKVQAAIEEIPFTEAEISFIAPPLAVVIDKYGAKTSPEFMLVMALLTVFASRLAPIFSK